MADVTLTLNADDAAVIASVIKQQREMKKVTEEVKKTGQAQRMLGKEAGATADASQKLRSSAEGLMPRFLGAGAALGLMARLMGQMRQDAEAAAAASSKIGSQAGRTAVRGEVASSALQAALRRQQTPLAQAERLKVAGALSEADPRLQDTELADFTRQVGALSPVADPLTLAKTVGRLRSRGLSGDDSLNYGLAAVLGGREGGSDEDLLRFANTTDLAPDFAREQLRRAYANPLTRNAALRDAAAAQVESRQAALDMGRAAREQLGELDRLNDDPISAAVRGLLPGSDIGPRERALLGGGFERLQGAALGEALPARRRDITGTVIKEDGPVLGRARGAAEFQALQKAEEQLRVLRQIEYQSRSRLNLTAQSE